MGARRSHHHHPLQPPAPSTLPQPWGQGRRRVPPKRRAAPCPQSPRGGHPLGRPHVPRHARTPTLQHCCPRAAPGVRQTPLATEKALTSQPSPNLRCTPELPVCHHRGTAGTRLCLSLFSPAQCHRQTLSGLCLGVPCQGGHLHLRYLWVLIPTSCRHPEHLADTQRTRRPRLSSPAAEVGAGEWHPSCDFTQ